MPPRPRTVVIVQARLGSSRLPGKVLEPLAGRTMLAEVLDRCGRIAGVDAVCCAVPESVENHPVADEALRSGAIVFRGAEHDVLDRYQRAALHLDAEVVLRVTSDCPYLDPAVVAAVLGLVADGGYGYACNNLPPTWPHGLDCEAFHRTWLDRAAEAATTPEDREHVTPWIRRQPDVRRANLASPDQGLRGYRWTVDRRDDLELARDIFARLPADNRRYAWQGIRTVVDADPDLARRARKSGAADRLASNGAPSELATVDQVVAAALAA